ncbi:6-phosphogluconolactonase, partial [Ralstonia solanacearum]
MTRFNRFRRTLMQWTGSLPLLGALPLSKLAQAQGAEQPAASGTRRAARERRARLLS